MIGQLEVPLPGILACDMVAGAPVAQSVELTTFNRQVPGSKPGGGTTLLSPAQLPANMRAKIVLELCPVAGLDGFCWAWTGYRMPNGYGQVGYQGKVQLAHRVAYKLLVGPIPEGLQLDHWCVYPPCINPAHTEPVTGKVNCERSWPATKLLCVNGHRLVGDNLIVKTRRNGRTIRNCRKCQLASQRRAYRTRVIGEAVA